MKIKAIVSVLGVALLFCLPTNGFSATLSCDFSGHQLHVVHDGESSTVTAPAHERLYNGAGEIIGVSLSVPTGLFESLARSYTEKAFADKDFSESPENETLFDAYHQIVKTLQSVDSSADTDQRVEACLGVLENLMQIDEILSNMMSLNKELFGSELSLLNPLHELCLGVRATMPPDDSADDERCESLRRLDLGVSKAASRGASESRPRIGTEGTALSSSFSEGGMPTTRRRSSVCADEVSQYYSPSGRGIASSPSPFSSSSPMSSFPEVRRSPSFRRVNAELKFEGRLWQQRPALASPQATRLGGASK